MNAHSAKGAVLLTTADIQRWKSDVTRIDQQIRELEGQREDIKARLVAAALFMTPTEDAYSNSFEMTDEKGAAEALESLPNGVSWAKIVEEYVRVGRRVTYSAMREAVLDSRFGDKFRESEKGYYHALSRAIQNGKIVKHNGYLFEQEALKVFLQAVAGGLVEDGEAPSDRPSPMAEAIIGVVSRMPGANSRMIVDSLKKNAEFAAVLTPHTTGAYNVIARLIKRRQLVKRDGGYHLGPVKTAAAPEGGAAV